MARQFQREGRAGQSAANGNGVHTRHGYGFPRFIRGGGFA
jgi:hypothetical protein